MKPYSQEYPIIHIHHLACHFLRHSLLYPVCFQSMHMLLWVLLILLPVIAFYYFFTNWVPARYKKAGLIAAVLFMLGSGYGWLYALNLELSYPSPNQISSIDNLLRSGQKTIDIWIPNTFIGVGHPDITIQL